jgi:hypothetical protein
MPKSKHRHRRRPIPAPQAPPQLSAFPPPLPLGYDPKGLAEPVDVVSSTEAWSEYSLEDGTVIRVKSLQLTGVNQAKVPERLKKKVG